MRDQLLELVVALGLPVQMACLMASRTSSVVMLVAVRQPRMRRA